MKLGSLFFQEFGKNQNIAKRIRGIMEGAATISECKILLAAGRLVNGINKISTTQRNENIFFCVILIGLRSPERQ